MRSKRYALETSPRQQDDVLPGSTHDHRKKIPALTGIRGYAALWVVAHHCSNLGWLHFNGQPARTDQVPFLVSGYLGVELFFILSGFILTKIYGHVVFSGTGLRDFALGRIFRILPVYWASLVALGLMAPWMRGEWQGGAIHNLPNLILSFLLIQSWVGQPIVWNPPGWSLSAEWLAYFLFPVLAAVVIRFRRPAAIIGIAIAALLALRLVYVHLGYTRLNMCEILPCRDACANSPSVSRSRAFTR